MFPNRCRRLRRRREVRKVETDFVLARLAGPRCGSRADCSRKAPTRVGVEPQRSERGEGIGFGILDFLFLIEEEKLTSRSCGTQACPGVRVLKRFNRLTETISPTERFSLR